MIPRNEYPRPQMVRKQWINLNGKWQFEADTTFSGMDRRFYERDTLSGEITVPFCRESRLSGIGDRDFCAGVWYLRRVTLEPGYEGKRVLLHIGAADYETTVFVNHREVGSHRGGYTSFFFDITNYLDGAENTITLLCRDENRTGLQPCGKQSRRYESHGCDYTRTTGIWQTVWLEYVHPTHLDWVRFYPDPDNQCVGVKLCLSNVQSEAEVTVQTSFDGKPTGAAFGRSTGDIVNLSIPLTERHLWDVGQGKLYDVEINVSQNGTLCDRVISYFGLRSTYIKGKKVYLNGRPVFQRLMLDQGYYEDGIYTAPTDAELENDVLRSMAMGFNGARLHQKVFEPRFLYHADRHGYLVWSEHGNWGLDHSRPESLYAFLPEWIEAVERDFNHPSIIGYCPFNETWDVGGRRQIDDLLRVVVQATKALDSTRPVIDSSGNFHVGAITDIYDIHDYEQNVEKFASHYAQMKAGGEVFENFPDRQQYAGQPYFVSEYGGIKWDEAGDASGWGYGEAPKSKKEFIERYRGLTEALLHNPYIAGFCYTQLYDVEQEVNGLYTYNRKAKFDPQVIREITAQKAAIEEEEA